MQGERAAPSAKAGLFSFDGTVELPGLRPFPIPGTGLP